MLNKKQTQYKKCILKKKKEGKNREESENFCKNLKNKNK